MHGSDAHVTSGKLTKC